jgi:hypothetical protein
MDREGEREKGGKCDRGVGIVDIFLESMNIEEEDERVKKALVEAGRRAMEPKYNEEVIRGIRISLPRLVARLSFELEPDEELLMVMF